MTAYSGLTAWLPSSDAPTFFGVDRSRTKLWQHPCLKATPPVAWPKRSAAGICHDHPDCQADAVMAARCRGFSDACVRGVAAPVWEAEKSAEEVLAEGVYTVMGIDTDARTIRIGTPRRAVTAIERTGAVVYRVTLP